MAIVTMSSYASCTLYATGGENYVNLSHHGCVLAQNALLSALTRPGSILYVARIPCTIGITYVNETRHKILWKTVNMSAGSSKAARKRREG